MNPLCSDFISCFILVDQCIIAFRRGLTAIIWSFSNIHQKIYIEGLSKNDLHSALSVNYGLFLCLLMFTLRLKPDVNSISLQFLPSHNTSTLH